jgi:hypothetical protein
MYRKTMARIKLVTAYCQDKFFQGPNQPGGVLAQMIFMKLTAQQVTKHGKAPLDNMRGTGNTP